MEVATYCQRRSTIGEEMMDSNETDPNLKPKPPEPASAGDDSAAEARQPETESAAGGEPDTGAKLPPAVVEIFLERSVAEPPPADASGMNDDASGTPSAGSIVQDEPERAPLAESDSRDATLLPRTFSTADATEVRPPAAAGPTPTAEHGTSDRDLAGDGGPFVPGARDRFGRMAADRAAETAPLRDAPMVAASAPSADRSPRAHSLSTPCPDGLPPMARPLVLVSLGDEQTRRMIYEALAAAAERDARTTRQIAEERVNYAFWWRDCEERAILGNF
jgi:hypothetical protein